MLAHKFCIIFLILLSCHSISEAQNNSIPDENFNKKLRKQLDRLPFDFSVSAELKNALRLNENGLHQSKLILGEFRLQSEASYYGDWYETKGTIDLGYDYVFNDPIVNLRELYIDIYPHLWWNLKAGRQPLTWGKGDFVFINDLFPKDFPSFFSGRDIQYLKAPSDALKLTINPSWIQVNLIYTPQFDPDVYVSGKRISFYDPNLDAYRGESRPINVTLPNDFFSDGEFAWRIQKNIKGIDLAFYGYYGFWKSPAGFDPTQSPNIAQNPFLFPALNVHGFSFENSLFGGVLATEMGYYYSKKDAEGLDFLIRNSELRWLVNYSKDFKNNFNVGLQFYTEIMSNHEEYLSTFPGIPLEKYQNTLTLKIRKLVNKQRTAFELFTFYSVTYQDIYLRPNFSHSINDYWKFDIGGNIFAGSNSNTFWNQFRYNTNVYCGLKYNL